MPRKRNPELTDEENPELTEADFAHMRPAADALREHFGDSAERLLKPKAGKKVAALKRRGSRGAKRRPKPRSARL